MAGDFNIGLFLEQSSFSKALAGLPGPRSWWALFQGDWKRFFQLWLDPYNLWFNRAFSGRPSVGRDSATDEWALFLLSSPNPAVVSWGIGIRILEANGAPISSGHPAVIQQYERLALAAQSDLIKQFGRQEGLRQAAGLRALLTQCSNPASNAACINQRYILSDQPYISATEYSYPRHKRQPKEYTNPGIDPLTGFPPTAAPPPPPPQHHPCACDQPGHQLEINWRRL